MQLVVLRGRHLVPPIPDTGGHDFVCLLLRFVALRLVQLPCLWTPLCRMSNEYEIYITFNVKSQCELPINTHW